MDESGTISWQFSSLIPKKHGILDTFVEKSGYFFNFLWSFLKSRSFFSKDSLESQRQDSHRCLKNSNLQRVLLKTLVRDVFHFFLSLDHFFRYLNLFQVNLSLTFKMKYTKGKYVVNGIRIKTNNKTFNIIISPSDTDKL